MKRLHAVLLMTGLLFTLSGCAVGDMIDRLVPVNDSTDQAEEQTAQITGSESAESHTRVYMDEVRGTLTSFTGSQLTLLSGTDVYNFDISGATIECEPGMVSGNAVSVIYEGQLSSTDTSAIKVLKVVDTQTDTEVLQEQTYHGQLQSISSNVLTVKGENGDIVTFPITGVAQYYQNGMKAGNWVYIHYKGNLTAASGSTAQSGTLTQVISVSDIDPMVVASPTPTPSPTPVPEDGAETEVITEGSFRGVIQSVQAGALTVSIENTSNTLVAELTSIPCYVSGGFAPGSHVTLTYTSSGGFNGTTADGILIVGVTGESPESLREINISFTYSGEITGTTGNTMTLITGDGAQLTCFTDEADNRSTGGLETGCSVRVTFNPAASRNSNLFTAMKIEDA